MRARAPVKAARYWPAQGYPCRRPQPRIATAEGFTARCKQPVSETA